MKKVLTIAGSDCSGGAGIQADLKTIAAHTMYGMSAITALTAQNTVEVKKIMEVTPEFLEEQLDCIFSDIMPDSIKIGMVAAKPLIEVIVNKLKEYKAKKIIVDPVMVSTSGHELLSADSIAYLTDELLPLASVITPNIPEAEILSAMSIRKESDMIKSAQVISEKIQGSVLIKGGHSINDATDLWYNGSEVYWFRSKRIDNQNTHGTGCTLSSAIACNLAAGYSMKESIQNAKDYLSGALEAMLDLGSGSGPLDHMYQYR